jgi:hypothetical protein
MANMFPPKFSHDGDRMRNAEKKFYDACNSQLGDDWTVLYEVKWFGRRDKGNERGDADFLLMNPQMGIFCVEVKGGKEIFIENNEWFTVPHGISERRKIRDPFGQAADSKSVLWDFIRDFAPGLKLAGAFGHFVVFPGAEIDGDISLTARRSLICDKKDLLNLPETILRISNTFGQRIKLRQDDIDGIRRILLPDVMLLTQSHSALNDAIDSIEQLTEQQLVAFEMLRNFKEFVVTGGAGTGKTVLAFNRAKQLASQGARTLFLCHSNACARHLRELVDQRHQTNFVICSSREFITTLMESPESEKLVFEDGDLEGVSLKFLDNALEHQLFWDALIVDEAQNIPLSLIELLTTVLPNSGERYVYIFGDTRQNTLRVKNNALKFPTHNEPIVLDVNCRSSQEIATAASSIFNEIARPNGLSGPRPILAQDASGKFLGEYVFASSETTTHIATVAKHLIDVVGLKPQNIRNVVLSVQMPELGVGVWGKHQSLIINPETLEIEYKIGDLSKNNPELDERIERQSRLIESGHYVIESIALPDIQGLEADGVIVEIETLVPGLPFKSRPSNSIDVMDLHEEAALWNKEIEQHLDMSHDGRLSVEVLDASNMSDARKVVLEHFKYVLYSAMTRARYAVIFLGRRAPMALVNLLLSDFSDGLRFELNESSPTFNDPFYSEQYRDFYKLADLIQGSGSAEQIKALLETMMSDKSSPGLENGVNEMMQIIFKSPLD